MKKRQGEEAATIITKTDVLREMSEAFTKYKNKINNTSRSLVFCFNTWLVVYIINKPRRNQLVFNLDNNKKQVTTLSSNAKAYVNVKTLKGISQTVNFVAKVDMFSKSLSRVQLMRAHIRTPLFINFYTHVTYVYYYSGIVCFAYVTFLCIYKRLVLS